jgi:hypothetical protein
MSSNASDITKQIKEVYNDDSLSESEKRKEARELLVIRNSIYRTAIEQVSYVESSAKGVVAPSDMTEDDAFRYVKRETNRETFGAEYALREYNEDTYAKAQEITKSTGISYDNFYKAYFAAKEATWEKGENGAKSKALKAAVDKAIPYATTAQKQAMYEAVGVGKTYW